MKWSVVCVLALALALVGCVAPARASAASATTAAGTGSDTEEFDAMVADTLEADAALADTDAFESQVEAENVDAEAAALTAETADDAAHEFEAETADEMEADTATEAEASADSEAELEAAAAEDAEDEEEGEADAEAEDQTEEAADAEADAADAEEEGAVALLEADESAFGAAEKAEILKAQPLLEFEEDVLSDAADDAEDASARADEAAAESRFRARSTAGALPTGDYDEAVAKEMLAYAQIAYYEADPSACAKRLGHGKLRVQHTVASDLTDGATVYGMTGVDKSKQRVVVAFNGNVEPKELTGQLMKRKPLKLKSLCKSCKTHPYYVQAYKKICPQITASVGLLLRKPAFRKFDVWITGHGFGGALAALCGYEMEMARVFVPDNKRVMVTFGQPRVGNAHLARKFNQFFPSAIRVTHADDPFPHVPPCHVDPSKRGTADEQTCFELKDRKKKLWAFHSPTQVWYPRDMPAFDAQDKGDFTLCNGPNWGEDPTCRSHPLGVNIDDHRNYFGVDVTSHCANLMDAPADA